MKRPRSALVLALLAFLAAFLPLFAATVYFRYREAVLATEAEALERRLAQLDAVLAPIGSIDQLRGRMLARKTIVDVLGRPQAGLEPALGLTSQLPAGTRIVSLEVEPQRVRLRLGNANDVAMAQMLERFDRAGFSGTVAELAGSTVTLDARIDPARLASLPATVTP
ncbi:MAG TPA: hypothetical protein VLF18_06025 [Tahibacter sp.]|uniref:hypothetical protein n=1 Tax=Tahibacter sp. TaxID=2056211 RepID=UPI002C98FD2A|nr:hypothetical protein [Tahibacter sp.]HSX59738.1 hypothetical protein [Tahibacter sp.]